MALSLTACQAHGASISLNELFKLTASDAAEGDEFGRSVGISGGAAIVGELVSPSEAGRRRVAKHTTTERR